MSVKFMVILQGAAIPIKASGAAGLQRRSHQWRQPNTNAGFRERRRTGGFS
jgi:hypothetical protein